MVRKNTSRLQSTFFSFEEQLSQAQKKQLNNSQYAHLCDLIFCNVKEQIFTALYSDKGSRPY